MICTKCSIARFILVVLTITTACNKRKPVVGQNNAVWAESVYLRGIQPSTGVVLSDEMISTYVETLQDNGIKYVYLFAGPYDSIGHLPEYSRSNIAMKTVEKMKNLYPSLQILPWIGGIQNKTVYLGDSSWVRNALADTEELVRTLDVPGVHIDFEFIVKGDAFLDQTINPEKPNDLLNYGMNVNDFHRKLRRLIPKAFISSVVTATSPDTRPWKRKTSMTELKVLQGYVDQLAFLYYDTRISDDVAFKKNCVALVKDIAQLKSSDSAKHVQHLIAIGTFINSPELHKYRNLEVESIENSLKTIRASEQEVGSPGSLVDGVALFCDWETSVEEWEEFSKYWSQ